MTLKSGLDWAKLMYPPSSLTNMTFRPYFQTTKAIAMKLSDFKGRGGGGTVCLLSVATRF